jgi:hypothetical protein
MLFAEETIDKKKRKIISTWYNDFSNEIPRDDPRGGSS